MGPAPAGLAMVSVAKPIGPKAMSEDDSWFGLSRHVALLSSGACVGSVTLPRHDGPRFGKVGQSSQTAVLCDPTSRGSSGGIEHGSQRRPRVVNRRSILLGASSLAVANSLTAGERPLKSTRGSVDGDCAGTV